MNLSDLSQSSVITTLTLWMSLLGLTTLVAVTSRGTFFTRWLPFRRQTDWVETFGNITRTDLFVRKQRNPTGIRSRIDFVVRIEFDYQNSAQPQNTWTRHGIQEVAYKRLDLAREAAAQYQPGTKIRVLYNAAEPNQSRFAPQWKKRV